MADLAGALPTIDGHTCPCLLLLEHCEPSDLFKIRAFAMGEYLFDRCSPGKQNGIKATGGL